MCLGCWLGHLAKCDASCIAFIVRVLGVLNRIIFLCRLFKDDGGRPMELWRLLEQLWQTRRVSRVHSCYQCFLRAPLLLKLVRRDIVLVTVK